MDSKLKVTVGQLLSVNSIIEVFRIFTINRDNGNFTKVFAAIDISFTNLRVNLLGFGDHVCRKLVGKIKFTDDNVNINPRVVRVT